MTERFDPSRALEILHRHGVQFVVIGGVAAALHGSSRLTFDLDVCYARDQPNLRALATALRAMNARLRGAPEGLPFILDDETLRAGDHFTFATDAGNVDILGTPKGSSGYEQLRRDADRFQLGGRSVLVTSIEMLMRMKEAAGRPQDRVDLEILAALREILEQRDHPATIDRSPPEALGRLNSR